MSPFIHGLVGHLVHGQQVEIDRPGPLEAIADAGGDHLCGQGVTAIAAQPPGQKHQAPLDRAHGLTDPERHDV